MIKNKRLPTQRLRTILAAALYVALFNGFASQARADQFDDEATVHYFSRHTDGWFWYKDPPAPPKKAPVPEPVLGTSKDPNEPPEVAVFEKMKKDYHNRLLTMMVSPTQQNIRSYVDAQTRVVRMADQVSDGFQKIVWANPEYDFSLERPVNGVGLGAFDDQRKAQQQQTLKALANTHVLYYFFRSDCPYCKVNSPVLASFASRHGITVIPISMDGGGTTAFPNYKRDNGISQTLGVTTVPALYVADPNAGIIIPVGFGALSESELQERLIDVLTPGSEIESAAMTRIPYTEQTKQSNRKASTR